MRDDFSLKTKEGLAKRVGYVCSNPECSKSTIGAQGGQNGTINIGEAAHICAASEGGKRYDPNMTSEERSDISNGIWLCSNCAAMIDRDEDFFTKEILHLWKELAERKANQAIIMGISYADKIVLSKNDHILIDKITSTMELSYTMYMLKDHDYHGDFQREHLNPLFELLDYFEKPTNTIKNYEMKKVVDDLIGKIGEFRWLVASKGGPAKYGNGSFIIDRELEQKRANELCNVIWDKYEAVVAMKLNLDN